MAILINTPPDQISLISDPVLWNITMTGLISGFEVARFGYQLLDEFDNPITEEEVLSPKEGIPFNVWFSQDVFNTIFTAPPQCDDLTRAEPDMFINVKLKYWEQKFNTDTCTPSRAGETETGLVTVLNSANQYWGDLSVGVADYVPLVYVPPLMKMCEQKKQFYYLYATTSLSAIIQLNRLDGSLIFAETITLPAGSNSLVLDPVAIAELAVIALPPATVQEILAESTELVLSIGPAALESQVLRIVFEACCDEISIGFQSFAGGYNIMHLEEPSKEKMKVKYKEICSFQVPAVFPNVAELTESGVQITDKTAEQEITLIKVLNQDDLNHQRYYQSFLASGAYYLFFNDVNGVEQMVKFIPKAGSIQYQEANDLTLLRITGRPNQAWRHPNNHN